MLVVPACVDSVLLSGPSNAHIGNGCGASMRAEEWIAIFPRPIAPGPVVRVRDTERVRGGTSTTQ